MFRVVYLDEKYGVSHKGGFKTDKEALIWIEINHITALKLLMWSEDIQCYKTLYEY